MIRIAVLIVGGCVFGALACKGESGETKKKPPEKSAQKQAPAPVSKADAGGAEVKQPSESPADIEARIRPPRDFDPIQACSGPFDPLMIPPVPIRGLFVKDQAVELGVPIEIKSGRMEIREDRVLLSLDSEELASCSPFKEDGDLASKPRLAVRLSEMVQKSYRFPDPAEKEEDKAFWYWNYVYTTDKDMPMTINAFTTEDTGELIIEEIDEEKQVVSGKVLLCKDKGQKGWAVGRFEVPICDRRMNAHEKKLRAPPVEENDAGMDGGLVDYDAEGIR